MQQDLFSLWEQSALQSRDALGYDTVCFFRNLNEIYSLYDEWKDKDRFYFIPLKLRLTYCMGGHTTRMTDDQVFLGSFIKTVLSNEDRFATPCPKCGRKTYPYGYLGPSLNRWVALEAICSCGEKVRPYSGGWGVWNVPFRNIMKTDKRRLFWAHLFHPRFKASTVESLMEFLWQ
jgi:hypothetical protein